MPIIIRVSAAEGVRYSVMTDDVTGSELLEAYRPVLDARTADGSLKGLVDMRGVRSIDVTAAAVWELTQLLTRAEKSIAPRRVAIVAPSNLAYGMARMFEALAASAGVITEYHVVRDIAEARDWLGLVPRSNLERDV